MAIQRILCPIDFSEPSRRALEYAAALARAFDAPLTVLHVFATVPLVDLVPAFGTGGLQPAGLTTETHAGLVREVETFARPSLGASRAALSVVEAGDVRREILAQAETGRADLLVMGSHGRSGVDRLILGSIAEWVVRRAACPVLVVPPHTGGEPRVPFRRILCAVDGSTSAAAGWAHARDLAAAGNAELVLLHALDEGAELEPATERTWTSVQVPDVHAAAEAAALERLRALAAPAARSREGGAVHLRVGEGPAHRLILQVAIEDAADLIVMGVQGRGAVDLLMFGSNTQEVLRAAHCPVLTVRR